MTSVKKAATVSDRALKQFPEWVRGRASISGGDVVMLKADRERYFAFDPEHSEALLFDLMALETPDPRRIRSFAAKHGMLWHGPSDTGEAPWRERVDGWRSAASTLKRTAELRLELEKAVKEEDSERLERYLRAQRDEGLLGSRVRIPGGEKCFEFASVELAERITRGMEDCPWIFVSGSGGPTGNVETYGSLDFRYGSRPLNLVAASFVELAHQVVTKKTFRYCAECGEMFRPNRGQVSHKRCGARRRKREQRAREEKRA